MDAATGAAAADGGLERREKRMADEEAERRFKNTAELIESMRTAGCGRLADEAERVSELSPERMEAGKWASTESLLALWELTAEEPRLRNPDLTHSEEGNAHAEWKLTDGGTIAVEFKPGGVLEFGGLEGDGEPDMAHKLRVGGLLPRRHALAALAWHISKVAAE